MSPAVAVPLLLAFAVSLSGCEYLRLARPSVLKQLNPGVARLVNSLAEMDRPNEAIVFDCPIANHAGRGMVGLILVSGDVVSEAKLDRPRQPRP